MRAALFALVAALAVALPAVATAPAWSVYAAPGELGGAGAEPSLGIDPRTGAVLAQAFAQTLRVTFDSSGAATWTDVTPPGSWFNLDPILATDAATGRTWAGGLETECSLLAATDDDGASWQPVVNACSAPSYDHETIGSGPWHGAPPAGASYPRAVYYCAQAGLVGVGGSVSVTLLPLEQCAVSLDGGITFSAPVPIAPTLACTGATGHVKVAADGTAFVPTRGCGTRQGATFSRDNGVTWRTAIVGDAKQPPGLVDPSLATTSSGTAWFAFEDSTRHIRVARSTDGGEHWSASVDVAPALQGTFPAAVAKDGDRAAVAFLGTDAPGNPHAATFVGDWDVYVATTNDAGATWTLAKVTDDPVQRGWICVGGTACSAGRNLADFIDATLDAEGRMLVAFADGCTGACASPGGTSNGDQHLTLARGTG